jgi:hypothetical protein
LPLTDQFTAVLDALFTVAANCCEPNRRTVAEVGARVTVEVVPPLQPLANSASSAAKHGSVARKAEAGIGPRNCEHLWSPVERGCRPRSIERGEVAPRLLILILPPSAMIALSMTRERCALIYDL